VAAANASARGQRHAILSSPRRELTGFALVVDCRGAQCGGQRSYAITALGACYGERVTVGDVLHQMRCARGCGGRPLAAWLVTGATLNERIRPRRVAPRAGGEGVTAQCAYEGRSEFHVSTMHFQPPSDCFFQTSRYLPRSVTGVPFASLKARSYVPRA
jgi:hypothetical protein